MRTATLINLQVLKVAGILQITLGTLFWIGYAYTLIPVHIVIGSVLVLALVTIGVLAIVARVRRGLAAFELAWGLALAAFGVQQASILIGPLHWIIRVVHLVMAIAAMQLGAIVGQAILAAMPATAPTVGREREAGARQAS
jgi:hypothetical protein